MDDRKNNGGAREGAGRKPKADEIKLIDSMDAIAVPDSVWKALYNKVLEGDTQAIKTWLSYRFGMPKQTVEQNSKVTIDSFNLKDVIKFKESNISIDGGSSIKDFDNTKQ